MDSSKSLKKWLLSRSAAEGWKTEGSSLMFSSGKRSLSEDYIHVLRLTIKIMFGNLTFHVKVH